MMTVIAFFLGMGVGMILAILLGAWMDDEIWLNDKGEEVTE